ncbi:MAG: stage IV sporulation protein A [Clostridia bacterium]|nr:stage IV sporulation protein A [Clostridia bacterium]
MQSFDLYKDIAERTQGDVYIGVVGPVRTGKSTFIQRFMELMVLPEIENAHLRSRMMDELPQSGSGRMVMTTQPAFVPNEAIEITLPEENSVNLRLIDCVGYMIEGALGTKEDEALRMVRTPWSSEEMPFEIAAEIGTKKVIGEHSTIGLVVTTDGSVTELPREAYIPAEKRVVEELKRIRKPFAMLLNTRDTSSPAVRSLREKLEAAYKVPVIAVNVAEMNEEDIKGILEGVLNQFPLRKMIIQTPEWVGALDEKHWLVKSIEESIIGILEENLRIGETKAFCCELTKNESIEDVTVREIMHGSGEIKAQIILKDGMFNSILAEQCGTEIRSDAHLLSLLRELVEAKREYDHVASALESVRTTGYGLVPPKMDELTLQEPEIIKQGGRFGVRLRASAPSLHLIRVDVNTEVAPVVGTEQQSEEMIRYLMEGFEQDPQKIWHSNLFGKPLSELVREGLANKLMHMPADAQIKLSQTLERIVNEGSGGMLCILL